MYVLGYGYLMAFLFSISFGSINHATTFIPMQDRPSINMVQNGIDPNNDLDIRWSFHLDLPIKYKFLTTIAVLIPVGGVLWYYYWCWLLIQYAFIYMPGQHWYRHPIRLLSTHFVQRATWIIDCQPNWTSKFCCQFVHHIHEIVTILNLSFYTHIKISYVYCIWCYLLFGIT